MAELTAEERQAVKQKVTDKGTAVINGVERNARLAHAGLLKLAQIVEDGYRADMIGALEAGEIKSHLQSLAGQVAAVTEKVYLAHKRFTGISDANGTELAQPMGGGTR